ncbi:hypothetical protein Csa_002056 [Cucumis sativus]|uniref:Uncharacterized protein n=1 Tax=Cucumis sativus TaxID=3659 RepID=A0A0A0LCZ2_CUCSA|nr:hypothetical protein Csa_002056 [Cucumis sativus]
MADSSENIPPSKSPLHFLFSCFRSSSKLPTKKASSIAPRIRRTSSRTFRFKKSSATVPVDVADPSHDELSFLPEFKKSPPLSFIMPKAPQVGGEIVVDSSLKPSQTRKKPHSTQSNFTTKKLSPTRKTAALLHSVSLPSQQLTRQKYFKKPVSGHLPAAVATTSPAFSDGNKPTPKLPTYYPVKNFDRVIMVVIVAIVMLWGRLCAILCTTALFYLGRRMRSEIEPDGGGSGRGRLSGNS